MDTKNTTFDDAVDQTEHATNFNYNKMMTNLPKENYKEYDVYIDWETGTKHTLGIDDNQMPHLISSEPANIIDKGQKAIADAGEAKVMASEATIEANQKLWEGAKNFFVRAPKDYWNGIKRTALKMNDSAIQAADFLTGGNYSILNKSISGETYYRNDDLDMTLTMRGEVLVDGSFENSATDPQYQNGGQFSAFDINGTIKEGWKEITLPMKRLQSSEYDYEDEGFGMPVLMEYGVQYGLPGVQMYKLLGKVPYLNTWGRVILAELGTEFVGSTQDEEDINMANMIVSFGYDEEDSQTVLRELLDAVAADIDDTAFERKVKNAVGNAPIGVGFAGVLQAFKFMKAFKNNKEGRKIVAEELGLKYKADDGEEGVFKILDADDNPIASVGTQEEADEILSVLGKGYKSQEFKSIGAAANTNAALKTDTPDFYSNVVNAINKINIPEKGMNITQFENTIKNTPGVKQSELDDMGFDEFFLDDKPALVTKERVKEFLEKKSLTERVNTKILPEENEFDIEPVANSIQEHLKKIEEKYGEAIISKDGFQEVLSDSAALREATDFDTAHSIEKDMAFSIQKLNGELDELGEVFGEGDKLIADPSEYFEGMSKQFSKNQTFFSDQVLPGGENYKEMLISSSGNAQIFTGGHFERAGVVPEGENLLAHVRFNERNINGKKTLFIEEMQSDLHQRGRKYGYNTSDKIVIGKPGVPDAPFKKNWHELSMKRIIKYAVDNGFDAISFTPASVQNARYSLSSYTDAINVTYNKAEFGASSDVGDGLYTIQGKSKNGRDIDIKVKADDLEAHVGKDLSEKILKDKDQMQLSEADEIKLENLKVESRKLSNKINNNLTNRKFANVDPDKKVYPKSTRNFYYKNEAPGLTVYYSYQTPIHYIYTPKGDRFNVQMVTRVNDFSVTTNRHMREAGGAAPDDRIPGWKFEQNLNEIRKNSSTGSKETYNLIAKQDKLSKQIELLNNKGFKNYSGKDLEIGGTGMKGFYDKMLPSFINKFLKKYNGKLTDGQIKDPGKRNEYYNVPYFEIPESMKLDISEKGVPIANLKQNKEMTASSMA